MSNLIQKKSLGFYVSAIVIVLTAIGMGIYPFSKNYFLMAEVFMGVVIAVELVYMLGGRYVKSEHWDLMSILVPVLLVVVLCIMFFFQVEQIGWCVAGLDGWDILTTFFEAVAVLTAGMLIAIVGCFLRQNKAVPQ